MFSDSETAKRLWNNGCLLRKMVCLCVCVCLLHNFKRSYWKSAIQTKMIRQKIEVGRFTMFDRMCCWKSIRHALRPALSAVETGHSRAKIGLVTQPTETTTAVTTFFWKRYNVQYVKLKIRIIQCVKFKFLMIFLDFCIVALYRNPAVDPLECIQNLASVREPAPSWISWHWCWKLLKVGSPGISSLPWHTTTRL